MGFDVVYLPPIHPIGTVNRKGPNNTVPGGNPHEMAGRRRLAVGDRQRRGRPRRRPPGAGHDGGLHAFVARTPRAGHGGRAGLRAAGRARTTRGSTEHPEWFTTKPDGTIAYAENPPKKYQDIYPINFDNDPEGIYAECLRVVRRLDRGRA